jgi:hypothetical protein
MTRPPMSKLGHCEIQITRLRVETGQHPAILAALEKRDGEMVISEGARARWRLRRLEESDN